MVAALLCGRLKSVMSFRKFKVSSRTRFQ